MMRRIYSNTAYESALDSDINDASDALVLDTVQGWPSPGLGECAVAALDFGEPDNVEIVTYEELDGNVLVGVARGLDGTVARAHAAATSIRHVASAKDIELIHGVVMYFDAGHAESNYGGISALDAGVA